MTAVDGAGAVSRVARGRALAAGGWGISPFAMWRTARCSLNWCRRGYSRLHPVVPGSAAQAELEVMNLQQTIAVERREASAPFHSRAAVLRHGTQCPEAPCGAPPPFLGGPCKKWREAKLGCNRIARTLLLILPRESGGGGPPEGWWRGRRSQRFTFAKGESSMPTPLPPSFASLRMAPLPRFRGAG